MIISVGHHSAQSIGGNKTYSLAGEFLSEGLGDFGNAVNEVWLVAHFRGGKRSLPDMYDRFHSEILPSLPKVKFFRKKAQIDVSYETRLTDASFLENYGKIRA